MSSTRYYLNKDGSLREVTEPGRCEWYFVEYQRLLDLCARERDETDQVDELRQAIQDKLYSLQCHVEACPECHAWLAQCERVSKRDVASLTTPPADPCADLPKLAQPKPQVERGRAKGYPPASRPASPSWRPF